MKTVKDLIKDLQEVDENLPVVLSEDSEGNGFQGWSGDYSLGRYLAGDFYDEEDDAPEGYVEVIVLWP